MSNRRPIIPRLLDGVDPRALPLTPIEGFVMSRVDGEATVHDLADLTNLDAGEVERVIGKLVELGVAEWADGAVSLPRASMRPATPAEPSLRRPVAPPGPTPARPHIVESRPPTATREPAKVHAPPPPRRPSSPYLERQGASDTVEPNRPASAPSSAGARVHLRSSPGGVGAPVSPRSPSSPPEPPRGSSPPPAPPPPSPPAASSEIELSPERRQRVDELYPVLELMDHYEVLGLDPSADLKQIRASYFERSKVFHPDTAFRKNLGAYKAKMEAIFSRLTEAYDVLGKKRSRAEYDAYLELQGDTRAAEAAMRSPSPPPAPARPIAASPSPPPVAAPPPPPALPLPTPEPAADAPRATLSEEGRRRARELLEKRLRGARSSASRIDAVRDDTSASAPRQRDEIVRDLAASLKGAASLTGGLDSVQRHVLEARRSEQAGDLATAARELRLATSLAPDRADVAAEQKRVSAALAAQLADKYEKAAEYEERHKKWAAAALSWSKVVEGRPNDGKAAIRAAIALVEGKGDLHQAQKLAQRACELAPESVAARVALGRVFMAAGLHLNAKRELERAALLDPGDQIVKNLLRELKG